MAELTSAIALDRLSTTLCMELRASSGSGRIIGIGKLCKSNLLERYGKSELYWGFVTDNLTSFFFVPSPD
jgi:hypothetical protein